MHVFISDANIVIDLHVGNLIKKLFKLPYKFAIPDIIFVEELEERHAYLPDLGLEIHEMDDKLIEKVEIFAIRYRKPSRNDLFAMVLAQHQSCPLLTGDKDLRQAAKKEGIEVHGTIWLIKEMYEFGLISIKEAEAAFSAMRAKGSRLPWKETEEMIEKWKREEAALNTYNVELTK